MQVAIEVGKAVMLAMIEAINGIRMPTRGTIQANLDNATITDGRRSIRQPIFNWAT